MIYDERFNRMLSSFFKPQTPKEIEDSLKELKPEFNDEEIQEVHNFLIRLLSPNSTASTKTKPTRETTIKTRIEIKDASEIPPISPFEEVHQPHLDSANWVYGTSVQQKKEEISHKKEGMIESILAQHNQSQKDKNRPWEYLKDYINDPVSIANRKSSNRTETIDKKKRESARNFLDEFKQPSVTNLKGIEIPDISEVNPVTPTDIKINALNEYMEILAKLKNNFEETFKSTEDDRSIESKTLHKAFIHALDACCDILSVHLIQTDPKLNGK